MKSAATDGPSRTVGKYIQGCCASFEIAAFASQSASRLIGPSRKKKNFV
jgi:hypothetical protein